MSSSTDPYVPQEKLLGITRALLEAMCERPPDGIVIQTHTTLISRDLTLIRELAQRTSLWVSITVETDREVLAGFSKHASSPAKRMETLSRFRKEGIRTQAAVSPLLPLGNVEEFARTLEKVADRVILDHYLLGDGSAGGLRTKRTNFPEMLTKNGFDEWNGLEKFWEVVAVFREIVGQDRVLISQEGFNSD